MYTKLVGCEVVKGNPTSTITIRLPDAVVARVKTMARRKRQTVSEMLKKVILGYVAGEYYSEEQVAKLCEIEPLAWKGKTEPVLQIDQNKKPSVSGSTKAPVIEYSKVGRNDPCPCGSGKKYKKCCGV